MKKKKLSIYLALILIIVLVQPVQAQASPSFTLQLSGGGIYMDRDLDISVDIKDYVYGAVYSTSAIDFSILVEPGVLEYKDFTTSDNFQATVSKSVYSDVYESHRIIISMVGEENALSSDERLITFHFQPKKRSNTQINIYKSIASTSTGKIFYPRNTSSIIRVFDPYDVNQDGVINIADLALVSYHVGKSVEEYPNYDVNRDGMIDIVDVDLITEYLMDN